MDWVLGVNRVWGLPYLLNLRLFWWKSASGTSVLPPRWSRPLSRVLNPPLPRCLVFVYRVQHVPRFSRCRQTFSRCLCCFFFFSPGFISWNKSSSLCCTCYDITADLHIVTVRFPVLMLMVLIMLVPLYRELQVSIITITIVIMWL